MAASVTCELQMAFGPSAAGYYQDVVLADLPFAYWRLGERSGTTVVDRSGVGYNGTLVGTYTQGVTGISSDDDSAVSLDGRAAVDSYMTVSASSYKIAEGIAPPLSLYQLANFTVECWLKWTVDQNVKPVLSVHTADFGLFPGWALETVSSTGKIKFHMVDAAGDSLVSLTSSSTGLNNGNWHHIAVVFETVGSTRTLRFYVDGSAAGTATPTGVADSTVAGVPFRISYPSALTGQVYGSDDAFVGSIDEVAIYDSALSATRIAAHYAAGSGQWTNVLDDVRAQQPIVCEYGIQGNEPSDRVADTGSLEFALDNSTLNSSGLLGLYSLNHANKRAGFSFNTPVRWKLTSNGNTVYKFVGYLADCFPQPGRYADRLVPCLALDWWEDAAEIDLPDLDAQLNKRGDELIALVLDQIQGTSQPKVRAIETGISTFAYALDGGASGSRRPKVREVINLICLSEGGYAYTKGNTVEGGVFVWENRHHRSANPTVAITLDDTEIDAIEVGGSRDDIPSAVQVFVKPTRVDAAATTVLFSLQTTSTLIQPGDTNENIFGPYRDPTNRDLVGGTATVAPVATTDYLMNSAQDGSGSNLTGNFSVTAYRTGLGVRFSITNNGATAGYVTFLQVRGKGIYRYDAMVEVSTFTGYGTRPLTLTMPYQNDVNVAMDVATYLAAVKAIPYANAKSVTFLANRSQELMDAALLHEPGTRIALSETVTGVDAEFTINSVRLEWQPGGSLYCAWGLEPAIATQFWLWGVAGASEWGETTRYGY